VAPRKELGVSLFTIRKAVHENLGLNSFARTPRHLLTATMKEKSLDGCKKLLCYFRHIGSIMKISSNKKIFTVNQVHNCRNDCYLAKSTEEVKSIFGTKHPAQVTVLAVLGSNGKKMPPYFF